MKCTKLWDCTTNHGSLCDSLQGVTYHSDHHELGSCSLSNELVLSCIGSLGGMNIVINCSTRTRSREGPSHCGGVLGGCQGDGLTLTSACDLDVICHVDLFLLHAVIAKVWHSPNKLTHAPSSFVPFRRSARSTTVETQRVFHTSLGIG